MQHTEIDCSPLVASPSYDPWDCFNSVAVLGDQAARLTWESSKQAAHLLVLTPEQKEAFRDFVRSSGAWDDEEIAAWSNEELVALCAQWISGDIREGFGDDLPYDPAEWDWAEYEKESARGSCPSSLYLHDGKLFWSCAR